MEGVKLGEGKGYLQRFFYGAAIRQSTGIGGKNCFFMWVQERPLSHGTLQFGTGEQGEF